MEISITKISSNGQIVIPAEIRRDAGIKPSTQFLVFNEDGNILLKQIHKEILHKDFKLVEKLQKSEAQIKSGKTLRASTKMHDEEIDDLLMG